MAARHGGGRGEEKVQRKPLSNEELTEAVEDIMYEVSAAQLGEMKQQNYKTQKGWYKMTYTNVFTNRYNAVVGGIVAVLTAVFGTYWYVFAAFLALNVIDWITGWVKANKKKEESSKVGAIGAVKKLGYWAVVLVAFLIASVFVQFGRDMLGVDLSFLHLIGWWVLAMLIVNEARSILENLVELGYNVPEVLIKGLAVTEKLIEAGIDIFGTDGGEKPKDGTENGNVTE